MQTMLGHGVYSFSEAARLARIDAISTRRWFLGRTDHAGSTPVLRSDIPDVAGKHAISFLDLIDLLVVGRFREKDIPLQTVRKVYNALAKTIDQKHPFSHAKLKVMGRTVFEQVLDETGEPHLREVLTGQEAMPRILERFLKDVEYHPQTGIAQRWNISPGVLIDPTRNLGKPMAVQSGTSSFVLARAFHANGQNADLVADLFDTTAHAVRLAARFEDTMDTRAAA